jgi:hypothetical protein
VTSYDARLYHVALVPQRTTSLDSVQSPGRHGFAPRSSTCIFTVALVHLLGKHHLISKGEGANAASADRRKQQDCYRSHGIIYRQGCSSSEDICRSDCCTERRRSIDEGLLAEPVIAWPVLAIPCTCTRAYLWSANARVVSGATGTINGHLSAGPYPPVSERTTEYQKEHIINHHRG